MQINQTFSCYCGESKGIKFRGIRCPKCYSYVILREKRKIQDSLGLIFFNLIASIILFIFRLLIGKDDDYRNDYMSNTTTNGKGDKKRPMQISQKEFDERWHSINWGKKANTPPQKIEDLKNKDIISTE